MPGQKPCPPGCACGHHNRPKLSEEERRERLRESRRRSYQKHADKRRAEALAYRWANRDRVNANAREYRRKQRDSRTRDEKRAIDYAWRFNLPPERFTELLAEQEGCCYLCSEPLDLEAHRGIAIDHDHACCRGYKSCGACVRGITCAQCNKGIGHFGDDPDRMRRVADRLEAANARLAAQRSVKPVQGEFPIDIKRAARRREESA